MTAKTQFNVRLPDYTLEQIDLLRQTYGLTQVQVIVLAIDRLTRDLHAETGKDGGVVTGDEAAKTIYPE